MLNRYDFDLGYVQGISDLTSIIMMTLPDDEVDAFWALVGLLDSEHGMKQNFADDQAGIKS